LIDVRDEQNAIAMIATPETWFSSGLFANRNDPAAMALSPAE
jgi:hypothetical protein